MGKKIVTNNPLFMKDTMNAPGLQVQQNSIPVKMSQNMGNATSDRFSKQLGQHGFLKHSAPQNNYGMSKYNDKTYDPNAAQSMVREEQEPYRREAGKTHAQGPGGNDQTRNLDSRSINRKLVEERLLRNQSVERRQEENNFTEETPLNHSFQQKYNNTLGNKHENLYQNQQQQNADQMKNDVHHSQIQKQYEQLQREQMEKEYEQDSREQQEQQEREYEQMRQGSMDSYNNQEQFDPRQNEPMDVNRDEVTQTPEHEEKRNNYRRELELQKENTSKPRDRMPSPYNPPNHQPNQRQVQFQAQPQVYQDQVSETHSKQGDFRSREVVEDVGKILNKLYHRS
jgi:hypothetical protein